MLELEDRTEQNRAVLNQLTKAKRPRSVSAVSNDVRIAALTEDLEEGHISVKRFLESASYTIIRAVNRGLNGRKKKKNV
ncbi:Aliphatic amidase expression-regulating protein [Frankliniella fusca]|uniref:Aliphatic amidase expression-regulating protein n=1 Tax=Frankliniella fusca TaxID=407009 RepID=A0AAE1H7A3_9NEOP|nr:Aliphatic amidase expression-regulating protein [Frankliniella fusca]